MVPHWLYRFCRWLLFISLALFALLIVGSLLLLPFLRFFSYEFVCGFEKVFGWAAPALIALFAASSGFVTANAKDHLIKIVPEEEEKTEE